MTALIVGLGNPGAKYEATRHNVGFWLVDHLARHHHTEFNAVRRIDAEAARFDVDGQTVWLLKPMAFMNRSGLPTAAFAKYYNIEPEHVLVAFDDLDLPPGRLRVRPHGGHGGHNGMRDLVRHLGTQQFPRLRIGIGHPGHASEVSNYVLSAPRRDEQIVIERALDDAVRYLSPFYAGDLNSVQNRLNTVSYSTSD